MIAVFLGVIVLVLAAAMLGKWLDSRPDPTGGCICRHAELVVPRNDCPANVHWRHP